MKIANEELKFKIYNCLNKNFEEEIQEEELANLRSISLNKKSIQLEDFDAKQLEILKYVETLTLSFFEIDDNIVEQINVMKNLKNLTLNHCSFSSQKNISKDLNEIIIAYPKNYRMNLFENTNQIIVFQIIKYENMDINKIINYANLTELYIYNCRINNFAKLLDFKELKIVGLDGSNKDDKICEILNRRNIKIEYNKTYLPN